MEVEHCEGNKEALAGAVEDGWVAPSMSTSISPLLAPMLSSAAMRAVCDDVACLQNMLDFEAALARRSGHRRVPANAPGLIATACKARSFDLAALAEAAMRSGNLAIPLVRRPRPPASQGGRGRRP